MSKSKSARKAKTSTTARKSSKAASGRAISKQVPFPNRRTIDRLRQPQGITISAIMKGDGLATAFGARLRRLDRKRDAAVLNAAGGSITYRFRARDLHLVTGLAMSGSSVKFRVLIDGQPPGASHGMTSTSEDTAL